MSAHFSALYEQTSGLVQWSPDGRYVATAVGQRLVVRDAKDSFEIVKVMIGAPLCVVVCAVCGWDAVCML